MSRQPGDLIINEYNDCNRFKLKFFDENQNFEWRTVDRDHLLKTLTGGRGVCRFCREQLGERSCKTKLVSVYGCLRHLKNVEIDRNEILIRRYKKKWEDKKRNDKKAGGPGNRAKAEKRSQKRSKFQSNGDSKTESNKKSERRAGRHSDRNAGNKKWSTSKRNFQERAVPAVIGRGKKRQREDECSVESIRLVKKLRKKPGEKSNKKRRGLTRPAVSRGKAIFEEAPSPTPRATRSGTLLPDIRPVTFTPDSTPPLLKFTPQLPYRSANSYYDLSNASQVSEERLQSLISELSLIKLNRSLRDLGSIHLTPEDRRLPALSPEVARTLEDLNTGGLARRRLFEDAERLQAELPSLSFVRREIVQDPENQIDLEFWTNDNEMRAEKPDNRSESVEANQAESAMEMSDFDRANRSSHRVPEIDGGNAVRKNEFDRGEIERNETARDKFKRDELERNVIRRGERKKLERERLGTETIAGDRKRKCESCRSKKKRSKNE